jgi:DNA-binding CsgD family transcriptional regulator
MPQTLADIVLTADERDALETLARAGRGRADLARRARIVLRLAAGESYGAIARGLGESTRTIGKWKRRFLEARVAGLEG